MNVEECHALAFTEALAFDVKQLTTTDTVTVTVAAI